MANGFLPCGLEESKRIYKMATVRAPAGGHRHEYACSNMSHHARSAAFWKRMSTHVRCRSQSLLRPLMLLAAVALLTGPARAQVASHRQSELSPEAFFERNDGQAVSGVMYLAYGSRYSVNLEKDGLSLVLYRVDPV